MDCDIVKLCAYICRGWAGHKWAEPSVTHLQQLLRHVYVHKDGEVKEKGLRARETMVSRYSYSAFGPVVLEQWKRILVKIGRKKKSLGGEEL
jgi:hypothetical protein